MKTAHAYAPSRSISALNRQALHFTLLALLAIAGFNISQDALAQAVDLDYAVVGSEKGRLYTDTDFRRGVKNQGGVTLHEKRDAGSLDIPAVDTAGVGAFWPASKLAWHMVLMRLPPAKLAHIVADPAPRLRSPLVIITRDEVARSLSKKGGLFRELPPLRHEAFPNEEPITAYEVSPAHLVEAVLEHKTFKDFDKTSTLQGAIRLLVTDPSKSSSGLLFAALAANVLSGSREQAEPAVEDDIRTNKNNVCGALRAIFDKMGDSEDSSAFLFNSFKSNVNSNSNYMLVTYESLYLETAAYDYPKWKTLMADPKRALAIVYLSPTLISDHPLAGIGSAGIQLSEAVGDNGKSEEANYAAIRHGFRPPAGYDNPGNIYAAVNHVKSKHAMKYYQLFAYEINETKPPKAGVMWMIVDSITKDSSPNP